MIEAILFWAAVIALPEAVVGAVLYFVTRRYRLPPGLLIALALLALGALTTVLFFMGVRYKLWAWPWLAFGILGTLVAAGSVRPEGLSSRRRAAIRVARGVGAVCVLAFPVIFVGAAFLECLPGPCTHDNYFVSGWHELWEPIRWGSEGWRP
jgi:hypothetical protein